MPLLLLVLFLPVLLVALWPVFLVQRYRAGKARRLARPWVATLTLGAMAFSTVFFLSASAITALWIPGALGHALAGLAIGGGLGVIGLALTRWEDTPRTLHYTPNRWLVLAVTLVVTARVLYGFWRSWAAASAGLRGTPLVAAFGVPESLAAGASVLGYYLTYSAGLSTRIRRWKQRAIRGL